MGWFNNLLRARASARALDEARAQLYAQWDAAVKAEAAAAEQLARTRRSARALRMQLAAVDGLRDQVRRIALLDEPPLDEPLVDVLGPAPDGRNYN